MILESKKGYSRVDHFSTREIKIITYLKVFFFFGRVNVTRFFGKLLMALLVVGRN